MSPFDTRKIKEVQSQSLTNVIYDQLEEMILSGKLKPGERINESQLSSELGISRAPIREACRQLEKRGIVEVKARRGSFVYEIDVNEVIELYDIRAAIDALAAEKAAVQRTRKELNGLKVFLNNMAEAIAAGDFQNYFKSNIDFHIGIVRISRNNNLFSLIEGVYNKASLCRKTNLSFQKRVAISYGQHKEILDAIEARNPDEASRLMKHHVLDAKNVLLASLAETERGAK
ncbi:MAG: GntR family transcriptional regulator [Thermodesulfobacteriota bacterium]